MPTLYSLVSTSHIANHMLGSFTTPNVSGWDFHAADNVNQYFAASPTTYQTWSIPQSIAFSNDFWKGWNKALRAPNKINAASADPANFNVARLREFAVINASGSQAAASTFINSSTGIYGNSANSTAMFLGIQAIGFYPAPGYQINSEGMPSNQNPTPAQIRAVLSPLCIIDFAARMAYYASEGGDGSEDGGGGGGDLNAATAAPKEFFPTPMAPSPFVTSAHPGLWASNFSGVHLTLLNAVYPLTVDATLSDPASTTNWTVEWSGIGEAWCPNSTGLAVGSRVWLNQIYDPINLTNGSPSAVFHLQNRVMVVDP